jgi:urease accessory protein
MGEEATGMWTIRERIDSAAPAGATLTLTFEERRKSRLRTRLDGGTEVALVLPRGTVLKEGDRLRAETGLVVAVKAAAETISTARAGDARLLARACYHLGNRHIPVEVGEGWARYLHDHVLDAMVVELGLAVDVASLPFEPEAGAYGGHGAGGHGGDHHHHGDHDHGHAH